MGRPNHANTVSSLLNLIIKACKIPLLSFCQLNPGFFCSSIQASSTISAYLPIFIIIKPNQRNGMIKALNYLHFVHIFMDKQHLLKNTLGKSSPCLYTWIMFWSTNWQVQGHVSGVKRYQAAASSCQKSWWTKKTVDKEQTPHVFW